MIKMLRLVAAPGATLALVMMATPVFAQAPTDAQREAIRSACRSDYMAHCSSVPPGGLESLQCLQKNMSSLSGSCKSAVNAVEAPAAKPETPAAAPKAETPAAAEPAKPVTTAVPAAAAPKSAPTAAKKPAAAPSAAGASTGAPTAAPAAAPAAVIALRPMRPREELFVLRSACGSDVRALCGGVPPAGGRIVTCLATNAASLSPACKDVLSQFSTQ